MEQQQQTEGPRYWWEDGFVYDPANDPWATPATPAKPAAAPTDDAEKQIDCGRCGGSSRSAELLFHLSWQCEAGEAWIEAAINDRQARPDRYRQAKKDLGARTLTDARAALAARKAN